MMGRIIGFCLAFALALAVTFFGYCQDNQPRQGLFAWSDNPDTSSQLIQASLADQPDLYGRTNIWFTASESGNTTLMYYNILGQLVDKWEFNGQPGRHETVFPFDGRQLVPGIYFCRLFHDGRRVSEIKFVHLVK